jgi:hypothetical protein
VDAGLPFEFFPILIGWLQDQVTSEPGRDWPPPSGTGRAADTPNPASTDGGGGRDDTGRTYRIRNGQPSQPVSPDS